MTTSTKHIKHRVVVTGLGLVTPLGANTNTTWKNLVAGKSGIRRIEHFDASAFRSQISGTVPGFDPTPFIPLKEIRKTELFVQYGMAAAQEAIVDAKLDTSHENLERIGVAVGSGIGGLPGIEETSQDYFDQGPRKISPFFIPAVIVNMVAGHISIKHGFQGPNFSVVSACATGSHNIGLAARLIERGEADVMIAGGSEKSSSPLGVGGFAAMRALSTRNDDPERASRPWDQERDGFVLSDGAGVMVLESLEHALARKASIYAELVGFGMSADAYHMTLPYPRGAALAMKWALQDADIDPEQVQYINAHATSTLPGDVSEVVAIKEVFHDHAYRLAVSGTKSMTGHMLGATGSCEAIFTVLALQHQMIPPTINLENPSPDCDLDFVPNIARTCPLDYAISNSFGFGGTNVTLAFKRFNSV